MKERLSVKRTANALAVTAGIISLVCYILILITPAGTVNFFGAIFHGIDMSKIAVESVSIGNGMLGVIEAIILGWIIVLGVIEAIILGWIIGWLFAKIYNSMSA